MTFRFQEIALPVETSLASPFSLASSNKSLGLPAFLLESTHVALAAVERCWAPDVYLDALAHRFWKLTLQVVSRLASAAATAPDLAIVAKPETEAAAERAAKEDESSSSAHLRPSATTANLREASPSRSSASSRGLTHAR